MIESSEALVERARAVLQGRDEIRFATLFGSFAKNRATTLSDVDIAVAALSPLSPETRVECSGLLSQALVREIDLVDLQTATGTILEQALCSGKILFVKDKPLYAALLKKLWYDQADMKPLYDMILKRRRDKFIHG